MRRHADLKPSIGAPSIAFVIGGLISGVLLVVDLMTDSATSLTSWMLPGLIAAYPFFGAFDNAIFGETIVWVVNAVIYGLPVFVALRVSKMLRRRRSHRDKD